MFNENLAHTVPSFRSHYHQTLSWFGCSNTIPPLDVDVVHPTYTYCHLDTMLYAATHS